MPVHASTIVPLQVRFLSGVRAPNTGGGSGGSGGDGGLAPTPLVNDGRVIVLGEQPLLEARTLSANQREVAVYGLPGRTYTLESSTHPKQADAWQTWRNVTLSEQGDWKTVTSDGSGLPEIFYRTKQ
jgi:hypothetical protein